MKHIIQYFIARFNIWRHRKQNKYWWIRLHCNHCGRNVFKHKGDYFILKNKIWKEVCSNDYTRTTYILCKKCTERLLGRKLNNNDYYRKDQQ